MRKSEIGWRAFLAISSGKHVHDLHCKLSTSIGQIRLCLSDPTVIFKIHDVARLNLTPSLCSQSYLQVQDHVPVLHHQDY